MAKDKKQWKDLGGLEKTQSSINNKNQEKVLILLV
jgi:hypothetical protein